MNLSLHAIRDRGQIRTERLVLKVLADDDIGRYVVFRTFYKDGSVTTGVTDTFWFPEKQVRAGDFIVLYSKEGTQSEKISPKGATSHFFYWFQSDSLWSDKNFAAVAVHAADWISLEPPES